MMSAGFTAWNLWDAGHRRPLARCSGTRPGQPRPRICASALSAAPNQANRLALALAIYVTRICVLTSKRRSRGAARSAHDVVAAAVDGHLLQHTPPRVTRRHGAFDDRGAAPMIVRFELYEYESERRNPCVQTRHRTACRRADVGCRSELAPDHTRASGCTGARGHRPRFGFRRAPVWDIAARAAVSGRIAPAATPHPTFDSATRGYVTKLLV